MTEKRYFKRMWGEEYYIFDSQTISENEFDEKVEYEDYQAFADSLTGDEVVELLNELHEEIEYLKPLANENTQYIDDMEDDIITFKQKAEKLEKENEELKSFIKKLQNYNGEIVLLNGYGYTKSYIKKLLNEKELEE